jgi:hypothetical protein
MKPCFFGPLTLGHLGSMVVVPAGALLGVPAGLGLMAGAGAIVMATLAWSSLRRRDGTRLRAALALGSYLLGGLHGAGLALVPALMPFCGPAGLPLQAMVPLVLHILFVLVGCWLAARLLSWLLRSSAKGMGWVDCSVSPLP